MHLCECVQRFSLYLLTHCVSLPKRSIYASLNVSQKPLICTCVRRPNRPSMTTRMSAICYLVHILEVGFASKTIFTAFIITCLHLKSDPCLSLICQLFYIACNTCSAQSGNLCNLKIALGILRIPRLHSDLEIAQYSCMILR